MELKGAVLLYTMAGLMVTFAGFSALLLAIRQAAGGRLSVFRNVFGDATFRFTLPQGS